MHITKDSIDISASELSYLSSQKEHVYRIVVEGMAKILNVETVQITGKPLTTPALDMHKPKIQPLPSEDEFFPPGNFDHIKFPKPQLTPKWATNTFKEEKVATPHQSSKEKKAKQAAYMREYYKKNKAKFNKKSQPSPAPVGLGPAVVVEATSQSPQQSKHHDPVSYEVELKAEIVACGNPNCIKSGKMVKGSRHNIDGREFCCKPCMEIYLENKQKGES